jgi:hypothetical protein
MLDYMAGFFDGDGSAHVLRRNFKWGYSLSESLYVASTDRYIAEIFKKRFGGGVGIRKTRSPKHKQQYCWYASGTRTAKFIEEVGSQIILKRQQLQLLKELQDSKARSRQHPSDEEKEVRLRVRDKIKVLNSGHTEPPTEPITPSVEYLAGFFDAEGSVSIVKAYVNEKPQFQIKAVVSNNNHWMLEPYLRNFGGAIHGKTPLAFRWEVSARLAHAFLREIYPFLLIKKKRVKIALQFRGLVGHRRGGWQSRPRDPHFTGKMQFAFETMRVLNRRGPIGAVNG